METSTPDVFDARLKLYESLEHFSEQTRFLRYLRILKRGTNDAGKV